MIKKHSRNSAFTKDGDLLPIEQRTFITSENLGSHECTIIDGGSRAGYVTIQIEGWISEVRAAQVKAGQVKYPYNSAVYGKGFIGVGKYLSREDKKKTKAYKSWSELLKRSYSEKYHTIQPTYKDVTVCDEWLNFQTFAKWFEENYVEGWHLDKDLLSDESKIYSPDTCIFVPRALNNFMSNKYSTNTSGYTGVSWDKSISKWRSEINSAKTNKSIYLGGFTDILDAAKAYTESRKEQAEVLKEQMKDLLPSKVIDRII